MYSWSVPPAFIRQHWKYPAWRMRDKPLPANVFAALPRNLSIVRLPWSLKSAEMSETACDTPAGAIGRHTVPHAAPEYYS